MAASVGLAAEGLVVRFGGLTAVNGVTLEAPAGRLTGLIGPNGAGKTTTFNTLSGLQAPTAGTVTLFGEDVSRLPMAARAQRGLGRTFQRMELFDTLTVAENVALGREALDAGRNPLRHVLQGPRSRQDIAHRAGDAMDRCGLHHLAGQRVGSLSTGWRRMVELARVIAGDFRILLLDEPSSGLDPPETQRFGAILRQLVADGHGILLVEHDMALVMEVCDYLYVIDFGQPIFEGRPSEVASSDVVRAAYLGSEAGEVVEA